MMKLTVCPILVLHVQLAKTEIAKSNMSSVIEKNVLRLEISVNNLESVQTLESAQQLCGVETGSVDVESLFSLQVVEQLSTVHKCQNKIQLLRRLE
jgi:hypothetical protein